MNPHTSVKLKLWYNKNMPKSIKERTENEYDISKSRFITILFPIKNGDEAKSIIKKVKKEYNDATHIVTAYILENEAHSNDDSEPKGTAGLPTLEVLRKNDLTNILALTIRYFGGIKLGSSGLFRSYTKSVSDCLSKAQIVVKRNLSSFSISFDYSIEGKISNLLEKGQILSLSKDYTDEVSYHITLLKNDFDEMVKNLKNIDYRLKINDYKEEEKFI